MNLGSFLAGFGPGLMAAQQDAARRRNEEQRNAILQMQAQEFLQARRTEADEAATVVSGLRGFLSPGGAPGGTPGGAATPAGGGMAAAPGGASGGPGAPAQRMTMADMLPLAQRSGFQGQGLKTILPIAMAETGGNPAAVNPNDPGGSYGLLQENAAAHGPSARDALVPQTAFDHAYRISKGGTNFSPWTTHKTGADAKYADEASRLVDQRMAQIPQDARGKMSLEGLWGAIDATPGVSNTGKVHALEKFQKFMSPFMQHQYQERRDAIAREQHLQDKASDRQWQLGTEGRQEQRGVAREERAAGRENKVWEDVDGTRFRYNEQTGKATDLVGNQPYQIKDPTKVRPIGGGAQRLGAGREEDAVREIGRLDREWASKNPSATSDERDAAHFSHREQVEKGISQAKSAPPRTMSAAIARTFMESHPDATPQDLIALAGAARREQALQTTFASGQAATQLRSLNTLADHIALTREYAEAMNNRDTIRANQILNRWSIETGHPEVIDYRAARTIMADEIVRLLTNTGGTESDRQGMQALFDDNASPEQSAGALNVATRFVSGRLGALKQQYARNDLARGREFEGEMLSSGARSIFGDTGIPTARERQGPLLPTERGAAGRQQGGATKQPGVIRLDENGNVIGGQ